MKTKRPNSFTLIEMIVVLGGIVALASALLVPMIRHLDEIARQNEAASLKRMAEAFQRRILTKRIIPDQTGWAAAIGAELGLDVSKVTNTDRGLRRVFLIDPNLLIGLNSSPALPYTQTVAGHMITNVAGAVLAPVNPHFLFLSSVGAALPSGLISGYAASTSTFSNIWYAPEGATPAGWSWTGRGEDLNIQRIDLSDLFVQLILNNRDTNLIPSYGIELAAANVPYGGKKPMYFLKGTELKLFNAAGVLEYSELLRSSESFTFEFGTWQSETYLGNSVGQASPLDLQRVMNLFMNAPTNQYAKFSASQITVSNAMVSFLTNYINWRDGSPSYNGQFTGQGKPPKVLEDAQTALATESDNILKPQ